MFGCRPLSAQMSSMGSGPEAASTNANTRSRESWGDACPAANFRPAIRPSLASARPVAVAEYVDMTQFYHISTTRPIFTGEIDVDFRSFRLDPCGGDGCDRIALFVDPDVDRDCDSCAARDGWIVSVITTRFSPRA